MMNRSKNALVDRHLKRVESWLKRCVVACKCGSWGDALAEAECLEAETKGLREKLWDATRDEALDIPEQGMMHSVFATVKITVLAMAMVLSAVIPISLDAEFGSGALNFASQGESVVLLSSLENDIINALRENLSGGNNGRVVISLEAPQTATTAESNRGAAMAAERAGTAPRIAEPPQAADEEDAASHRRPSAEEVIALIQVGQRALRSSEPGVIVVP